DRHPREMTTLEDRLKSRFQGGLVVDVQPPEFEARMAILQMWAKEDDVPLQDDVLVMLARNVTENIRNLRGAYNAVAAKSRIMKHRMSLETVESDLGVYVTPRQRISLQTIIERVAGYYEVNADDLIGKKRTEKINVAR